MPNNRFSILILSHNGLPVKQITMSKLFIRLLLSLVFICLIGLALALYDYSYLRNNMHDNQVLQEQLGQKIDQVAVHRKTIQEFALQINQLKTKLLELNTFEDEIRAIAKIDKIDNQEYSTELFGVGGPIPDDLDPQIPVTENHDALIREMYQQTRLIDQALNNQKNGFQSLTKELGNQLQILAHTPTIHPCKGRITSTFGYRKSPFDNKPDFHEGYDIANKTGTPIIATADGVVSFAGYNGPLGLAIKIDHGNGISTYYAHAKKLLKAKGDTVKKGEVIAQIGMTGRTTGPHVHYEVLVNNVPVNPGKFFLD